MALMAQLKPLETQQSLGDYKNGGAHYADYRLVNTFDKKIVVLRVKPEERVSWRLSSKEVNPGDTLLLRLQMNPLKKGKLTQQVELYHTASLEPIVISLSGNFTELPQGRDQNCPDFTVKRDPKANDFTLKIIVQDAVTKQPVRLSTVTALKGGLQAGRLTVLNGFREETIPLGLYYWIVEAPGYEPWEAEQYVNRNNDTLFVQLNKKQPSLAVVEEPEQINETPIAAENETFTEDTVVLIAKNLKKEVVKKPEVVEDITVKTDEFGNELLDETLYKPNHVVFLIDVSSSMRNDGRMELLKASLVELMKPLRPIDRLSVVIYSSTAQVILEAVPVTKKDSIVAILSSLSASGLTKSNEGLDLAYGLAQSHFIDEGNNAVFLASDGEFRLKRGTQGDYPKIEANAAQHISTSCINIKGDAVNQDELKTIANTGGGTFLLIKNYRDAQRLLLNTVKLQSKK